MEQMLLAYDLPKEIFSAKMMLYKNTNAMVRSPEGDTVFFNIVAGDPQHHICLSYLPNPSARVGYDTRSIFKRSLTGLNSEYSFS